VEVAFFGKISWPFLAHSSTFRRWVRQRRFRRWGLLWRKFESSKSLVLLQVGGLTCRWQRHSVKPSCWECSTSVVQAETQLRVVVPIEEEEEGATDKCKCLMVQPVVLNLQCYLKQDICVVLTQQKFKYVLIYSVFCDKKHSRMMIPKCYKNQQKDPSTWESYQTYPNLKSPSWCTFWPTIFSSSLLPAAAGGRVPPSVCWASYGPRSWTGVMNFGLPLQFVHYINSSITPIYLLLLLVCDID
jgi:hypothetical protein